MPVYLRRFYLQKLVDYKTEENKQIEKAQQKSDPISTFQQRFKQ